MLYGEDKTFLILVMSIPKLPVIINAVSIATTTLLTVSTLMNYYNKLQAQPLQPPPSSLKINHKRSPIAASLRTTGTLYNLTLQPHCADIRNAAAPSCIQELKTDGADILNNLTSTFGKLKIELPEDGLHCKQVEKESLINLSNLEALHRFYANMMVSTVTQELSRNGNFRKVSMSLLKDMHLNFLSANFAVILIQPRFQNIYLLVLTFVISIVHSVFEFLAFKNDIQFWNKK